MHSSPRFALVGPGRAGTAVSQALTRAGWRLAAVAGREPDARSTRRAASTFDVPALGPEAAVRGVDVVVVATPDQAVASVVARLAGSLEPGVLVVHLSGSSGLEVFDDLRAARPDVRVAAAHPLQTLPGPAAGGEHPAGGARLLSGVWFAVEADGPEGAPDAPALVAAVGGRAVSVADRVAYHATACVASNHLVALLGQVERLAVEAGVPPEAFEALIRTTVDNVFERGAAAALTGPVSRGDIGTVARHLDRLPGSEAAAYRALALAAARLAGTDEAFAWLDGDRPSPGAGVERAGPPGEASSAPRPGSQHLDNGPEHEPGGVPENVEVGS